MFWSLNTTNYLIRILREETDYNATGGKTMAKPDNISQIKTTFLFAFISLSCSLIYDKYSYLEEFNDLKREARVLKDELQECQAELEERR